MAEVTGSGASLGQAFRNAIGAVSLGGPRPSYTARQPVAQARQLTGTRRGKEAMTAAGVRATPRTVRGWLSGKHQPSKRNREALGRAYGAMQRGGIPDWVKQAELKITGRVQTGSDVRNRGTEGHAPLRVDMGAFNKPRTYTRGEEGSIWDAIEEALEEGADDDELEDLISEGIEADVGGSDGWEFPGGGYTVVFSG